MVRAVQNARLDKNGKLVIMGMKVKDMRLLITNVYGILSKRLQLIDLANEKSRNRCLTETKLKTMRFLRSETIM